MFSYGKRPYENVPTMDLPDLLEKGERLPSPFICTTEVSRLLSECEYQYLMQEE